MVVCCNGTVELEVTLSGGGRVIRGLQRPATGRSTWIVCGQSLASKCRVEPTVSGWGKSNSRFSASSKGTVAQVTLFGGVDRDVEVSFYTTLHQQAVLYLSFKSTLLDRPATGRSNFRQDSRMR